jgi:hypothetical protein
MGNTAGVRFHHAGTTSIFETQTAADDLLFKTTPSGGSTTERLRITSDGTFVIKSASTYTGEQLGRFEWWNENGAGIMAKISCVREADAQAPGALAFYTSPNVDSTDNGGEGSWAERLRIKSDGKVGINENTPINFLTVSNTAGQDDAIGNVQIRYTGDNNNANSGLTVKNYRGTSQFMQWDGNGVRIGSRILTNSGAGNIYFTTGTDSVKAVLVNTNGNFELSGGGNVKVNNGAGIDFSDHANTGGMTSELLDDYEEGTFTPVLGGGSPTFSANNNKGYYIKVGRLVHISIQIDVVVTGAGSGNFTITGLPYAAGNDMGGHGQALSVGPMYDWDYPANIVQLGPRMNDNSSQIKIWVNFDAAADSILGWPLGSSGAKYGSIAGTYVAA